jgi:hypothetical protein
MSKSLLLGEARCTNLQLLKLAYHHREWLFGNHQSSVTVIKFNVSKTDGRKTKQNKTKQNKTKQNKTKQNKTKQNKTKQNKTKQNKPSGWIRSRKE